MTASTAPITLPARHRTEAPVWRFHATLAWISDRVADIGLRHVVVLAIAAAMPVAALIALLTL